MGCLTKNSVKSRQKQRKSSENYYFGEFLVRTEPGANGFRAEIVVIQARGVYAYTERGNGNRIKNFNFLKKTAGFQP